MLTRLLALLAPPWTLPTWKEIAVVVTVAALARGWYDERQKYRDMADIARTGVHNVEECRTVLGARLKLTEERVTVAEDRAAVLYAWLTTAGVDVPPIPEVAP